MLRQKKILFGLSYLLVLVTAPVFVFVNQALAADASWTRQQVAAANWAFTGTGNIEVKIGTTTVTLTPRGVTGQGNSYSGQTVPLCNALLVYIADSNFTNGRPRINPVTATVANFSYRLTLPNGSPDGCVSGPATATIDTAQYICNSPLCSLQPPTPPPPPGAGITDDNSCEGRNNTGFEWILCGVLRTIDQMVESFLGVVEGLLNFNTEENLNDNVKQAWTVFRNIATALLVIVMLVMVISQAISAGPFDAYTVRKILPRLVAAVILMQISWYLFSWVIGVANSAGQGIADLMYAPFGGADQLNLDKQIGRLGDLAPGITVGLIFGSIVTAKALSAITIFGVFFLALSVVISLLIGLVVLIFRQMLIILCMILVPIAIAAWILPGTQRYWKLWSETFMKLLIMFPLIMALIASGRIFAWVAGNPPAGDSEALAIISILIIFVGFFGPFWFIPKTFQWGGQVLGNLAGIVNDRGRGIIDRPRRAALEGAKFNRQDRAQRRLARLAYGESRFRRVDELLAGRRNLLKSPNARRRQYEASRAQGMQEAEKAAQEAVVGSRYASADHQQKLAGLFAAAQGHEDALTGLNGNNPAVRRWALDRLEEFGDWDAITNLRSRGLVDEQDWQAFVAKKISSIHQKAPHLSPLKPDLTELSAEEIPQFHNYTMQELEEQATHGVVRNAGTGMVEPSADPVAQRRRGVELATRFFANPNVVSRATREQIDTMQRVRNLGGTELLAADDPSLARPARINYGVQIGSGNLTPADQDTFEDNMVHMRSQAATSTQARDIYQQVISAAHNELAARVQRAEQEAVAQGLTPAQIANARAVAQAAATADRARLVTKGLTPL